MTTQQPGGDSRFGATDASYVPGSASAEDRRAELGVPTADPTSMAHSGFGAADPGFANSPSGFLVAAPSTLRGAPVGTSNGSAAGRWLLVLVLVLVAALVGGLYLAVHAQSERDDKAAALFHHTTLSAPTTVGDLTLGVGPGVDSADTRATLALAAAGLVSPVTGGYVDGDGNSAAYVAAGKRVTKPSALGAEAATAAKGFGTGLGAGGDAAPVTLTSYPAGALGGVLECGGVKVSGNPATYCVAVDPGAVVTVLLADTDAASAATTAVTLRDAVERRSS